MTDFIAGISDGLLKFWGCYDSEDHQKAWRLHSEMCDDLAKDDSAGLAVYLDMVDKLNMIERHKGFFDDLTKVLLRHKVGIVIRENDHKECDAYFKLSEGELFPVEDLWDDDDLKEQEELN